MLRLALISPLVFMEYKILPGKLKINKKTYQDIEKYCKFMDSLGSSPTDDAALP